VDLQISHSIKNRIKTALLLALIFVSRPLLSLQSPLFIVDQPLIVIHTPDSILTAPPGDPIYAADKKRYSTCPGITWAQKDAFLITANYLGKFVGVFEYDEEKKSCRLIHRLGNAEGMQLGRAADVSITKDGKILAVGNSGTRLNIYEIADLSSCKIHPIPKNILGELSHQRMHGVAFSSDSRYLTYTTIDDPDQICIYRLERAEDGSLRFVLTQKLHDLFHPLKPKSLVFSPDDRYVVLCFSERSQKYVSHKGILASYAFDSKTGMMDLKPLSATAEGGGIGLISPEGITFACNGSALLVTDQVLDVVTMHDFNAEKGTIGEAKVLLKNPEAQLSFPHGIAVSSDGRRLAVSNLGDDKINIYAIE
jgi:6-phosphogluconolactonase (cycloisomerase 2 family)